MYQLQMDFNLNRKSSDENARFNFKTALLNTILRFVNTSQQKMLQLVCKFLLHFYYVIHRSSVIFFISIEFKFKSCTDFRSNHALLQKSLLAKSLS